MPHPDTKTKIYLNGVELTPTVVFAEWQPGFEYTKNISLKNLNTRTVKITYNVPQTKSFATLFSKTITLSPGTTFTLPITFRPLEKVAYEDFVELYQIDFQKSFKIPLIAKLPEYKIELDKTINLGPCSIGEFVSLTVKIKNNSKLDTLFEWDLTEPFSVSPLNGEIKANASIDVTFKFEPKSGLVYKAKAIFKYGGNPIHNSSLFREVELYGAGKYPHLLIENGQDVSSELTLNFEKVMFGQSITKYFTIVNMTEVRTDFFVERNSQSPLFDWCFNCLQHMGTLQPFDRQKIAITYSPNYPSTEIIYDYFNVFSSGRLSKNTITCVADNEVPMVSIDKSIINFGLCNIQEKVFRTLNITNHSKSSIEYQFDIDNSFSSFKINCSNGTLNPNETKLIQITFIPEHPIIYYKKVACVIQNHKILYTEFIGTCHSELMKPPELNKKNVNLYYFLKKNKLHTSPPEPKKLLNGKHNSLEEVYATNIDINQENTIEEYFNDNYHYVNERNDDSCISADKQYIDFGASNIDISPDETSNPEQTVSIFNKTKSKVTMFWNSNENSLFSVSPTTFEIPPMKSYSIRIKFHPTVPEQFYSCQLEGYAIYKSLSNYTLAEPKFILPSWCVNINCIGHTFHPSSDTYFLPRYTVNTENVVFPATIKDKPIYRTFILKNTASKYPLVFDLKDSKLNTNGWYVKPHKGLIKKNEHQIFILKFSPKADIYVVDKCEVVLNYMNRHLLELGLIGVALLPLINLDNNGILYFSPTCKGNSSKQSYEITNLTRGTISYEWRVPYECKNIVSIDEFSGVLQPYEKKSCVWKFSPEKIDKYNFKITLLSWVDKHKHSPKVDNLRILGACTNGSLQSLETYKDFGSVIVGSSISSEVVIVNNNDCKLDFELFVKQTTDEALVNKSIDNICILELEKYKGHIEARSRYTLRCRLRPVRLINYQFTIEYRIVYPEFNKENKKVESSQNESPLGHNEILCYMTANGVYPKLNVIDIKALGTASSLSKDYLWKLLSINELNSSMSCEPNPDELVYSIATRQEANRRLANQNVRQLIEMNFNAAPLNSDDSQVILFVENTGYVPTDWILLYPKDLLLELEYWAQSGDYDLDELEEMKVQDNKLFTIEPRKGHLEPGETVQIRITYKHLFTGQNKLPILMKIAKGREIMLNFVGCTVPNGEPYIYFPSNKFEFEPIEIGLNDYPIQVYELHNGGDVPAIVEIDDSFVEELNQENYSCPILKCVGDKNITIPPGTCYETKWKFAPIEAKTYQVEILFKVNKISYNVVTFKCIGYDKRKLSNIAIGHKSEEIPDKQVFMLPNQLASLSFDRIVLGNVPLFTRERKVLFVKNNSSEHKISFTWHVTNPDHIRYIRIQPSRGIVDPSKSKMCKLTFIAIEKPAFYNIDLICEIKNETDMNTYRRNVELWKKEQNRQFEEFVIDEDELENRLKSINRRSDLNDIKLNDKKPGSQLAIHKFKTIPPIIKNNSIEESNIEKVRKVRDDRKKWKKPLPPQPFLLHLNVLCRTQGIDEYLQVSNLVKTNCKKYVDPVLGFGASVRASIDGSLKKNSILNTKILCNEEENSALESIFCDLLRNLITDNSFHSLVLQIKDEEVPYFFQYVHENDEKSKSNNESNTKKNAESTRNKKKNQSNKIDSNHNIKNSPIFGSIIENLLENTLSNIMIEAFNKEFNLTSRPRLIALPPKLSQTNNSSNNNNNNNNNGSFITAGTSLNQSKSKNVDLNSSISPILSVTSTELV